MVLTVANSMNKRPAAVVYFGAKSNFNTLSPPFKVKVVGLNEKAAEVVVKVRSSTKVFPGGNKVAEPE